MKAATTPAPLASPSPAPGPGDRRTDGPLPALLVGMTVVTGLVDAFSYLSLGHVFVANMTANVVFLGFDQRMVIGNLPSASSRSVLASVRGSLVAVATDGGSSRAKS